MINPRSEWLQSLLDKTATGKLDRRRFLSILAASGGAAMVSQSSVAQAMAAGSVQQHNRENLSDAYDYVIVGGGASGCLIAARMAEAGASVLLVEAGGEDAGPQIDDPSIWFTNIGGPLDWTYQSDPAPELNGRAIPVSVGKVLGGGSSVNASLWVHGFPADFDDWAADGCPGWSYEEVLPYFRKLEDWEGGANKWRGAGGPMHIRLPDDPHPTARAWVNAFEQMGYPVLEDMNAPMREGTGFTNMSINADGSRASAARAYLRPALSLPNLTLLLNTLASKLLFTGDACTGVQLALPEGMKEIRAEKEVILCAGGVASAQLLMLSGVGNAADLSALGIDVVNDLPGVGENFQDHPLLEGVIIRYKGAMPPRRAGSNAVEATSFVRSGADRDRPDIQPVLIQAPVLTPALQKTYGAMPADAFTLAPGLVRPTSRGSVKLASADHRDRPRLDTGMLSTDADIEACVRCIDLCRELAYQPAFDDIRGEELVPGRKLSKEELVDFARNSTTSYFHPVGTCRMGSDERAVVAPDLKVHGLRNLRVCDSSIMPTITTGNTNAPAQMIGARAVDFLLASI